MTAVISLSVSRRVTVSLKSLSGVASSRARNLMSAMSSGITAYEKWQSFRAGRSNATLAMDLGRTEAEVADMDSCFASLLAIEGYADNGAPTQLDYMFSMRKFT